MTVQVGEVPAAATDVAWPGQLIEAELAAMLGRRFAELEFLGADIAPFDEVLGRLVRGPGKRLRPAFVYWGYRAAGGAPAGPDADAALRVGCAVEFLHVCALICDDLMDGSPVRRWEPAAHVRLAGPDGRHGWPGPRPEFGRAAALVLGLQAFTWADAALCDAGLRPGRLAAVLRLFTTLRTEVIGGQYLDLVHAQRGTVPARHVTGRLRPRRSTELTGDAERIIRYKSAKYTVERPLQLGAAVAGNRWRGRLPVRVWPAARGGVPAPRRRARGVRRPGGHRQARRGGHPRGQADPAAGAGQADGRPGRAAGAGNRPREPGRGRAGHRGRPHGAGRLRGRGRGRARGSPAWPGRPGPRSRPSRASRTMPGPPCSSSLAWPSAGAAEMPGPAVVIGAGLAGLAAAIHLAAAGRDVTVVEAGDGPGGCCGTAAAGPYRFDTGPSVLTMPRVIEETIGAAGEDLRSWLPLEELDPYYRLAFHDGSHLDVLPGADRMAGEVSRLSGAREAARYLRFRRQLELLLEAEWEPFVARDFRRLSDLVQVRAAVRLARLGALRRMSGLAERYLTDWRLIRAHTFQALYVGLDPARAPGIYSIVSTMDTVGGVHIPARGGMHAVPLALADVAAKAGAQFRYGAPAERVLAGGSGITGVRLAGGRAAPGVQRDRGR